MIDLASLRYKYKYKRPAEGHRRTVDHMTPNDKFYRNQLVQTYVRWGYKYEASVIDFHTSYSPGDEFASLCVVRNP